MVCFGLQVEHSPLKKRYTHCTLHKKKQAHHFQVDHSFFAFIRLEQRWPLKFGQADKWKICYHYRPISRSRFDLQEVLKFAKADPTQPVFSRWMGEAGLSNRFSLKNHTTPCFQGGVIRPACQSRFDRRLIFANVSTAVSR